MKLKIVLLISVVATPLFMLIMMLQGAPLKMHEVSPQGILNFEFAQTVEGAKEIYAAWHPDLVNIAIKNTLLDFLFIVAYASLLYSACRLLSNYFTAQWRKAGRVLSTLMIVAAFFDVVENLLMFRTLSGHFNKELIASTFIFASLKFLLAGAGVLYILCSLAGRVIFAKRKMSSITDSMV